VRPVSPDRPPVLPRPAYTLSRDAFLDVKAITRYSIVHFGPDRTDRYMAEMERCLATLAENPKLGRDFSQVVPNLRRHEHQSHVVYYRENTDGIFVLRILGAAQDPARHL
jgi:toxin ParE1/3/4